MDHRYTIDELCRITGVKRRTVHFYVQEKLLPPPAGRGMGGFYDERHVGALKEILRLRKEGRGLAAIGNILRSGPGRLMDDRVLPGMEGRHRPFHSLALPEAPASGAPAGTEECVRYRVSPGVEILVDRKAMEQEPGKVRQLIAVAGGIFRHEEER